MKKICDRLIIIYLFIQPFLDMLISFGIRNNNKLSYLGIVLRGLFFVIAIIYLFVNKIARKSLYAFLIYFILAISYYFISDKYNIVSEISNLIQIFYIIFLVYFFNNYDNKGINDKLFTYIFLIYSLSLPITRLLGIGFDINELYFNKHGYLGLFYSGNELCAILILLIPSVIRYLKESKNIILIVLSGFACISTTILLGSKTFILAIILYMLYFVYKLRKNKKVMISLISLLVIGIAIVPFTSTFKNIKANFDFYNINNKNLISIQNVDRLVFSMRLSYVKNINDSYIKADIPTKLFGIGKTGLNNIKDTEIDITDIFYSIGIIGSIVYLALFIIVLKNIKITGLNRYTFILIILISLFAGHVFTRANVTLFISSLFKKDKI